VPCKPIDISLLALPSFRTVAYLCAFRELGYYPAELIMLSGSRKNHADMMVEAQAYNYAAQFFDVALDPLEWCGKVGARITLLNENDINETSVVSAVENCVAENILFSASGIVGSNLLKCGKRFIHVHPGILPDYRGSTCFYYSLLETGEVSSTSFLMTEGLDAGPILASSTFEVNYYISLSQPLFLDYILDPYIRAHTFKKVLLSVGANQPLNPRLNPPSVLPACYVMHPLLRVLTTQKLRENYVETRPNGIFEKKLSGDSCI